MFGPERKFHTKEDTLRIIDSSESIFKVGFAHGCFDVIGSGHIKFLYNSSKLCDFLICSVSSDSVVRRTKGIGRPVFSCKERMFHLASLEYVNCVIKCDEENASELIKYLSPVRVLKGHDTIDSTSVGWIIEKEAANLSGGEVVYVVSDTQRHTTEMIDLIPQNELNVFS